MVVVTRLPAQRAALEPAEERRDWGGSAACLEADPELFFPVAAHGPGARELARAKAVCAACRGRRQCLQYALPTPHLHGRWGGARARVRRTRSVWLRLSSIDFLAGFPGGRVEDAAAGERGSVPVPAEA